MTYSMATAVHEAAHAVIDVVLDGFVDVIHLRTKKQLRAGNMIVDSRGRECRALGMVEGMTRIDAEFWLSDDMRDKPRTGIVFDRDAALKDMIVLAAGPVAEARHTHESLFAVMLGHGAGDWAAMSRRAELLADRSLLQESEQEARRLVTQYWGEIRRAADVIRQSQVTGGRVIEEIVKASAGKAVTE